MSCKTLSDTGNNSYDPVFGCTYAICGKQDFRQTRVQIADCTGADGLV